MEQNKRECKIVQDLLPNYVENLTDEVTNEYIQEHIKTCDECRKALENVNTDIQVEELNQDREIKYLKKVRSKIRRTIMLALLLIIIVASCAIWYVYTHAKIQVNNYTFLRASYVLENEEGTKDGKLYCTLVAMIDEKGICKSVRVIEDGYTQDIIKNKLKEIGINNDTRYSSNSVLETEKLHYNINIYNGLTQKELEDKLFNEYCIKNIETI